MWDVCEAENYPSCMITDFALNLKQAWISLQIKMKEKKQKSSNQLPDRGDSETRTNFIRTRIWTILRGETRIKVGTDSYNTREGREINGPIPAKVILYQFLWAPVYLKTS